jgi:class 3 adenylate cyclase
MHAATLVATNVEYLNHQLASDLGQPIEFGIGIHGGEAIVGDFGFRSRTVFTVLGDAVNVAARLQDMTKTLNCQVIISTRSIPLQASTPTRCHKQRSPFAAATSRSESAPRRTQRPCQVSNRSQAP